MPILADQLTRGRGKFRARVVIEGCPYIPVSDRSLVRTLSDGREQVVGLNPMSIRIAASADLARAQLREQEMTLELVDTKPDYLMTRAFHRAPTLTTWLTATVSATATSIEVADTTAWPSSGVIHIGTEAITYTSKDATHFLGCTRGAWDTIGQAHFVGSGDATWYPPVTDLPRSLTDRRIFIYLYGSADSDTGDGTLRWRGIARTDIDFAEGVYSIGVDPVSRRLEQQLGGDLEEPVPIRGIYLPSNAALTARVCRMPAAAWSSYADIAEEFRLEVAGFFETQQALVDEINTQLAAGTSGWGWDTGAELRAEVTDNGWKFVYRTSTGTVHYVAIIGDELYYLPRPSPPGTTLYGVSPTDLFTLDTRNGDEGAQGMWGGELPSEALTMVAGTVYEMLIDAPVPRTTSRRVRGQGGWSAFNAGDDTYPLGRIYLGGTLVPTADAIAVVRASGEEGDSEIWRSVDTVDTTNRWIEVGGPGADLGPQSVVKLLRVLARGSVADLLLELVVTSPTVANSGAMPLLTTGEINPSSDTVAEAIASIGLGADRVFVAGEGVSLGELLEEELKLVGCYLALDGEGKMYIKRLGLLTSTAVESHELGASTIRGTWPRATKSPDGMLGSVLIKQQYDPIEGDHKGLPIRVRNTTAPSPSGGVLTIAPRSRQGGAIYREADAVEIDPEEAFLLASAVIGIFGEPYEIVSLMVGLESFDLILGQTILLTTPLLPGSDGTMGVTSKPCLLVGYDWSPFEGRGTFELLSHDRRIAGYSPAFPIASQQDGGDDEWELAVTEASYAPSGTDATDWFAAGDEIRITERDTATPTRVSGTVTAVTAGFVYVALDGTWTPGSSEWRLGYDRAPSVDETAPSGRRWAQTAFLFVAGADRRIGFASGDVDAYQVAP